MTGTGKDEADGKEFRRVAEELRVRMTDGVYPLGSCLPAQSALATEFGVSRNTVQRVIEELRNEGWIESRQGKGSRVIKNQRIQSWSARASRSRQALTLGPLIGEAFERPEVTLDVYTLTSESLDAHIRMQAERIRAKEIAPERIALRMMLPSESLELPYWRTGQPAEDERLKARFLNITRRYTESLRTALSDLQRTGLVASVDLQIRRSLLMPYSKLYLLNGTEAVAGQYKPYKRSIEMEDGEVIEGALDVEGLGAGLTHHVKDAELHSQGTVFVDSMQGWFDSVWDLLTE